MLRFSPQAKMPSQYIPILVVAIVVAMFPAAALVIFKRNRAASETTEAGETPCPRGLTPEDSAAGEYSVRFYIAGALFVIFDVAIVFLFCWAIKFSQMGVYGLFVMLPFVGILLAGYAWLYKNGALDWI
jgi:NADH-quinone oxidoreductase subunit A